MRFPDLKSQEEIDRESRSNPSRLAILIVVSVLFWTAIAVAISWRIF